MELISIILAILIYFIPSMAGSDKRNSGAIFALNLLLGWTVIGWIVALIWACTKDRKENTIVITDEKKTWTKEELRRMLKKMEDED